MPADTRAPVPTARVPRLAALLGGLGLLPQAACLLFVAINDDYRNAAGFVVGWLYAALILSFLGGLWWGLAAAHAQRAPRWLWIAAVVPSLYALAMPAALLLGPAGTSVSLVLLAAAFPPTLLVDRALQQQGLAPAWWLRLRAPLSLGLCLLTALLALLA